MFSSDKLQCLAEGFDVQGHLKKQPLILSLKWVGFQVSGFSERLDRVLPFIVCWHDIQWSAPCFNSCQQSNIDRADLLDYFFSLHVFHINSLKVFFFSEVINIPGKAPDSITSENSKKSRRPESPQISPNSTNKMSYYVVKERAACRQGHLVRGRQIRKAHHLSLIFEQGKM